MPPAARRLRRSEILSAPCTPLVAFARLAHYHTSVNGRDIQQEADMTPHVPKNVSNWLPDRSFITIIDNTLPPQDPEDDDEDAEDEGDGDESDNDLDPAVIREPEE
jgi:hypothetical protein